MAKGKLCMDSKGEYFMVTKTKKKPKKVVKPAVQPNKPKGK